jgi:hypothetical protein
VRIAVVAADGSGSEPLRAFARQLERKFGPAERAEPPRS